MILHKYTEGFVCQAWDTELHKWVSQEFIASDSEWETEDGNIINSDSAGVDDEYLPFHMEQP